MADTSCTVVFIYYGSKQITLRGGGVNDRQSDWLLGIRPDVDTPQQLNLPDVSSDLLRPAPPLVFYTYACTCTIHVAGAEPVRT